MEVPLDDAVLLQAIGEMTVEATRLEHHLAYLVAIARDEDEAWLRQTLSRPGQAVREVDDLLAEVGEHHAFSKTLRLLAAAGRANLADRSVVVHSVAMLSVDDGEAPKPVWWHPRSDAEHRFTVSEIRELAHDLRRAGVRAIEATTSAKAWRSRDST